MIGESDELDEAMLADAHYSGKSRRNEVEGAWRTAQHYRSLVVQYLKLHESAAHAAASDAKQ